MPQHASVTSIPVKDDDKRTVAANLIEVFVQR